MPLSGGCHCGAVRYEIDGATVAQAICHCSDCRRNAGAPFVAWGMLPEAAVRVTLGAGQLTTYRSSEHAVRQFCKVCGAGLFYRNAVNLPGLIDVQTATLDDPEALAPTVQVQAAEKLVWVDRLGEMPAFPRFPNQDD